MPVDKFGRTETLNTTRAVSGGMTLNQANNTFLRRDGGNAAAVDINLDSHKLINVADPTNNKDAANKEYVDASSGVSKSGDIMTGNLLLNVGSDEIRALGCTDVSRGKKFVIYLGTRANLIKCTVNDPITLYTINGFLFKQGINKNIIRFGMSKTDHGIESYQDITMTQHRITDLHDPNDAQDAATKHYVDTASTFGPTFCAYNSIKKTIPTNVFNQVLFDTVRFDTDSKFDKTTGRFTPGKAGYYLVNVFVEFHSSFNNYYVVVQLYQTGSSLRRIAGGSSSRGSAYVDATGSLLVHLNDSDYLELYVNAVVADDDPDRVMSIDAKEFSIAFLRPP